MNTPLHREHADFPECIIMETHWLFARRPPRGAGGTSCGRDHPPGAYSSALATDNRGVQRLRRITYPRSQTNDPCGSLG
jgi:hypothetical protein